MSLHTAHLPIHILLYGNSILMERLASRMQPIAHWDVKQLSGGNIGDVRDVDFIVTDLSDLTTASALPMLCAIPGVVLVGVDAIADTITVLTGRSHSVTGLQVVLDTLKEAI